MRDAQHLAARPSITQLLAGDLGNADAGIDLVEHQSCRRRLPGNGDFDRRLMRVALAAR